MKQFKYVGKRYLREDSLDRALGKTKFLADCKRLNMLYGKLILSEHAHADFQIDTTEAMKVPGVYRILTYKDIPHYAYNSMEWFTGIQAQRDEYILNERARFVGDRIGLILADSKEACEDAWCKIKIEYQDLPVIASISTAQKEENFIHGQTNLAYERNISYGDFDKNVEEADFVVEDRGSTPRTHHLAIEPHMAMAEVDDFGNLIVYSPGQVVFATQMQLARILQLPYAKIRVLKCNLGGSFGGKQQPLLELTAGVAAWITKRPVQIYMNRKESMIGTFTRNGTEAVVTTAVRKDGKILARKVDTCFDGGGYDTNNTSIVNAYAKKLFRLYRIPAQKFHGRAYYTNKTPGGACRAYGGPQNHAITEVNIDHVARVLGMDPCELRLKNLVEPYDADPVGGPNLGKAAVKECLQKGMEAFHWKERYAHIREQNTDRYAYGVGVACADHGNGYFGAFPEFTNVEMILNPDGTALVKIAVHEQGCGTLDSLRLAAAEALDLEPHKIAITEADTLLTPYDSAGTQASRVTFVSSGAILKAGTQLREKIFQTLHEVEKIEPALLYTDNGTVHVKGSDRVYTYGEIATMREKKLFDPLSVYVHYEPHSNPAAYAVSFAQVKVDKKTGLVEVQKLLCAHDIGQAMNPMLVEGQIQGGAQFILGMALSEELVYDSRGNVKNSSLSKYHTINVQDMPPVDILLVESHDESSPFGLKSVGEMSAVAPGPAVVNAINYALGTELTDYPLTPERIIEALDKKG